MHDPGYDMHCRWVNMEDLVQVQVTHEILCTAEQLAMSYG